MEMFDKVLQDLCDQVGLLKDQINIDIKDETKLIWEVIHTYKLQKPYKLLKIFNNDFHTYFIFDSNYLHRGKTHTMILLKHQLMNYKFFAVFSNDKEIYGRLFTDIDFDNIIIS